MTSSHFMHHSRSHLSLSDTMLGSYTSKPRKTGCSGCLFGCLSILALTCLLFAGLFSYVYFMDKNEALGAIAVKLIKNQSINLSITADINNNQNLSFDEKVALNISYDKILSEYDNFPKEKQKAIKRNLGVLIKKFIQNPLLLQTGPPPQELIELTGLLTDQKNLASSAADTNLMEEQLWYELIKESENESAPQKPKIRKRKKKLQP